LLDNSLPRGSLQDNRDAVYVPRLSWITGDLDIHDVGFGAGGPLRPQWPGCGQGPAALRHYGLGIKLWRMAGAIGAAAGVKRAFVRETAFQLRELLETEGLNSWPKLNGPQGRPCH
jgi:hypothetical protein